MRVVISTLIRHLATCLLLLMVNLAVLLGMAACLASYVTNWSPADAVRAPTLLHTDCRNRTTDRE